MQSDEWEKEEMEKDANKYKETDGEGKFIIIIIIFMTAISGQERTWLYLITHYISKG